MLNLTFDGSLALVSCHSGGYKFASVLRSIGCYIMFSTYNLLLNS